MKRNSIISLATFFSILVIICIIPVVFFEALKTPAQPHVKPINSQSLESPIPASREKDLENIQIASNSGTISCTNEDPSICPKSQEGKVLEYNVGCTGKISSASIYICRAGRWEYIDWTNHGSCNVCNK